MSDEETTLDDFFAKKDKGKKTKKKKKPKTSSGDTTTETPAEKTQTSSMQASEWNDFEEKKEKDYSSLKIQSLQVNEESKTEEVIEDEHDEEDIDGGPKKQKSDKSGSKWADTPQPTPAPTPAAPVEKVMPNVVSGKYVPPSMKRSMAAASSAPMQRRRPGVPPDISSQAAFPSLSAASQDGGGVPNDFEMVRHGTRSNDARINDSNRPRLDLGNRYDGLRS